MLKNYLDFYDQKINGKNCPFVAIKTLEMAANKTNSNTPKLQSLIGDLSTMFANISCEIVNEDIATSMSVNIQNCNDCPNIKSCSTDFRSMIQKKINDRSL